MLLTGGGYNYVVVHGIESHIQQRIKSSVYCVWETNHRSDGSTCNIVQNRAHLMNKELSLICRKWRTTTSPTRLPALTSEVVAPVCCQVPSLSHTASHSLGLNLEDRIMILQN